MQNKATMVSPGLNSSLLIQSESIIGSLLSAGDLTQCDVLFIFLLLVFIAGNNDLSTRASCDHTNYQILENEGLSAYTI